MGRCHGTERHERVLSVDAKSDTGITTLIEATILELKRYALTIGVFKHHSYLSSFDTPGKDTTALEKRTLEAVSLSGIDADVEEVTDYAAIAAYGSCPHRRWS